MATTSNSELAVRESRDAEDTWDAAEKHVIQVYADLSGKIEEWTSDDEFKPDPRDAATLVLAISNVVLGAELRRLRWHKEGLGE